MSRVRFESQYGSMRGEEERASGVDGRREERERDARILSDRSSSGLDALQMSRPLVLRPSSVRACVRVCVRTYAGQFICE